MQVTRRTTLGLLPGGHPDPTAHVHDFQRMMGERYKDMIEELTGRKVVAFLSQAHLDPDITLEVFFVDRPLDGFGAAELVEPKRIDGN